MKSEAVVLLDCSVLIALGLSTHTAHERVTEWFAKLDGRFATCPITQGAFIRVAMKLGGVSFSDGLVALGSIVNRPTHQFMSDELEYFQISPVGIVGHAQVTDAYLAQPARHSQMRLATLDRAQAALHADVAFLVE